MKLDNVFIGFTKDGKERTVRALPIRHSSKGIDGEMVHVYHVFIVRWAGAVQRAAKAHAGRDDTYHSIQAIKGAGGGGADCAHGVSADTAEGRVQP